MLRQSVSENQVVIEVNMPCFCQVKIISSERTSIPRIELFAAVASVRLHKFVQKQLLLNGVLA